MKRTSWGLLLAANVLCFCVLSLWKASDAAPRDRVRPPFANAVAQRIEMIRLLKQIDTRLKEQNALLRSEPLKVILSEPDKLP